MKIWPTLYLKNKSGNLSYKKISVLDEVDGVKFIVTSGEIGSTRSTHAVDLTPGGDFTAIKQRAETEWKALKKLGYLENAGDARATDPVSEVELPELADFLPYEKHSEAIEYPAALQSRHDGIRVIAVVTAGVVTIWNEKQKRVPLHHIERELAELFPNDTIKLDCELVSPVPGETVKVSKVSRDNESLLLFVLDFIDETKPFLSNGHLRTHLIQARLSRSTAVHVLVADTAHLSSEKDLHPAIEHFANLYDHAVLFHGQTGYEPKAHTGALKVNFKKALSTAAKAAKVKKPKKS